MAREKGFIVIDRSILDWEWYSDINVTRLFIHLLLKANYKETRYQGHVIPRGSLVVGRKELSLQTGISEQSVRTALDKLKKTGEITIKSTNKFSVINVENWGKYQDLDGESNQQNSQDFNQQSTNNQPTTNQQLTTSKPINQETNKPYIEREDKPKRFIPPTLEEVKAYCSSNGYNVDCERFVAFYESNGWKVGKNKMKDWKASVRGWHSRNKADGRYITESEPKEDLLSNSKYEVPVFMDKVELAKRNRPVIED